MGQDLTYQNADGTRTSIPVSEAKPLPTKSVSGNDVPVGSNGQLTSMAAAVALPSVPTGALRALVQAEGQSVRWRDDGVAPTASVGTLIYVGQLFEYTGDLSAIRFIETAASAKLNVSYYR